MHSCGRSPDSLVQPHIHVPDAVHATGPGKGRERPGGNLRFPAPAGVPPSHLPAGSLPSAIFLAEGPYTGVAAGRGRRPSPTEPCRRSGPLRARASVSSLTLVRSRPRVLGRILALAAATALARIAEVPEGVGHPDRARVDPIPWDHHSGIGVRTVPNAHLHRLGSVIRSVMRQRGKSRARHRPGRWPRPRRRSTSSCIAATLGIDCQGPKGACLCLSGDRNSQSEPCAEQGSNSTHDLSPFVPRSVSSGRVTGPSWSAPASPYPPSIATWPIRTGRRTRRQLQASRL